MRQSKPLRSVQDEALKILGTSAKPNGNSPLFPDDSERTVHLTADSATAGAPVHAVASGGGKRPPFNVVAQAGGQEEPKERAFRRRSFKPGEQWERVSLGLGVTAQIVWVTPEVAKNYLATRNMRIQRNIVPSNVASMARMLSGPGFDFNAQPIIFDWNGRMIDGQNRCEAVIQTGKEFLALVIDGIDPDSFQSMDQGARRKFRDALKAKGFANANVASTALNYLLRYKLDPGFANITTTGVEITEMEKACAGIDESVTVGCACRHLFGPGLAAALHYLFRKIDRALADEMFERLIRGDMLSDGNPVLSLRNTLIKIHGERRSEHFYLALVIKAWNLLRSGKKAPRHLSWDHSREDFPEIK